MLVLASVHLYLPKLIAAVPFVVDVFFASRVSHHIIFIWPNVVDDIVVYNTPYFIYESKGLVRIGEPLPNGAAFWVFSASAKSKDDGNWDGVAMVFTPVSLSR